MLIYLKCDHFFEKVIKKSIFCFYLFHYWFFKSEPLEEMFRDNWTKIWFKVQVLTHPFSASKETRSIQILINSFLRIKTSKYFRCMQY